MFCLVSKKRRRKERGFKKMAEFSPTHLVKWLKRAPTCTFPCCLNILVSHSLSDGLKEIRLEENFVQKNILRKRTNFNYWITRDRHHFSYIGKRTNPRWFFLKKKKKKKHRTFTHNDWSMRKPKEEKKINESNVCSE